MIKFIKMMKDDSGAAAAEYALILAVVGTGIALAAYNLGTAIKNTMQGAADCIATNTSAGAPSC